MLKRFVTGESCGFNLDDMRCWEFDKDDGFTNVTFVNGTTTRFREDLREAIKSAQQTSVVNPNPYWGGPLMLTNAPHALKDTTICG